VADALVACAAAAAAQSVALESDVSAALPPLDADARRLRQVLDNLLSNALRHTPPGGTVRVGATLAPSGVAIHISDTGEGIPADEVPFVFDRFYRVDRSRARASGGSGLGLAIVKRLTESHGGCVMVESTPGAGSRFTLAWPVIQTGADPA
jgi:two-component system, OmpR family, sensor histidine kinase BaeS